MGQNFQNEDIAEKYKWPKQEELILLPPFLELLGEIENKSILDVGCGSGWISKKLSKSANKIVAFDSSEKMIELAKTYNMGENIKYYCNDILDFSSEEKFDMIISTLTMHLVSPENNFLDAMKKLNSLLVEKGNFFLLLPHPCFSMYNKRDYNTFIFSEDFNYFNGSQPYRVQLSSKQGKIEFISNFYSLANYSEMFEQSGFSIKKILEPKITEDMPFYVIFELIKVN